MMSAKTAANQHQPLRVGFDLDGVILYNPIRIVRPFITIFKKYVLHKTKTKFYVPQGPLEQWVFRLLHKSSIFVAPGLEDIRQLVGQKKITAYLITARFAFLKDDLERWLDKIHAPDIFTGIYFNELNEQPHQFKGDLINGLKLDIFIDDNWDIVKYLDERRINHQSKAHIFWIYNFFDRRIPYHHKYPDLKAVVNDIKNQWLPKK